MKPSRAPSPVPPDSSAPLDFPSRAAFNNSRPGSRSGGSLRRVVLVLLLFFGALELFTRFKLVPMSKDLRRFQTYPARAARLHAAPGLRVAFVGNSATERAIDLPVWQRALNRQYPTSLDVFTADASHINAWQPIANHLFWSPGQAPDVLIVPFFNRSLEDGNELEIGRLAQFFTSPREMSRALGELPDTGAQFDFLLSSVWATYATRSRLKERVLGLLVPDYRGFTEELQGLDSQASPGATASPAPRVAPTYRHLEQLARDARANHCRLIFVALPWRDAPYPIAPTLVPRLKAAGAFWLDLRHAPGLTPRFYEDSIHLSPQGRRVFTAQFLPALAPLLRAASARRFRAPIPLIMLPFKLVSGLSSTLATLSIIAIPLWVLGIPGVQNSFARGWKMGFGVLIGYPPACALAYLPLRAMNSRLAPNAREDWQFRTSVVALLIFLIAAARMVEAWRIMLDPSAS